MEKLLKTQNGTAGIEIINLSRNGVPRPREEILINFSKDFNSLSNNWIEDNINQIWAAKIQENSRLYNQSKFRFAGLNYCNDNTVVLNIGLTSYKDLMGTNCHSFGNELAEYGAKKFGDRSACFSDALGVGSLVLTKDLKFLFMKRALWTGEDKGKVDRPGGHPEPDNVPIIENPEKIRDEIFDSVLNEIRDEMNLPVETLTDPIVLGVVRSLERFGRPSAEFFVRCSLTSSEIEARYSLNTQPEADESVGILFIPEKQLQTKNLELSLWQSLTDAACGAIELYHHSKIF